MGDPKKQRKKFSTPSHPWQKERIEQEKEILKQYGLRRKYEIWKADSMLKKFLNRAKTLIGQRTSQSETEKKQLMERLYKLGLLKKDSRVEDALNLKIKDVLERRLQTVVCRKHMANTMMQARQFIVHENVAVGTRKVTAPSYLVTAEDEPKIRLVRPVSPAKTENAAPEKKQEKSKEEKPVKEEKAKESK